MEKEILKKIIRYQELLNLKIDGLDLHVSNKSADNAIAHIQTQHFYAKNPDYNIKKLNEELAALKSSFDEFNDE